MKIFGIPIRLHVTFLLLLALIGMSASGPAGVTMIVLVFCGVLLHELGHSLVARHFGVGVESITLLPIGGVATMKTLPKTAKAEMLIAMAGPVVSVLLGLLFAGITIWLYGRGMLTKILLNQPNMPLIGELATVNLILAGFNLIPAFPMDGGRILRAFLWARKDFFRATRIAVQTGQGLAIGFFLASLVTGFNFWLILIALFIYFGAEAEGRSAEWRETISDSIVADAMLRQIQTLRPDETISDAVDRMLESGQENFPILAAGETVGMLTKPSILGAVRAGEGGRKVSEFLTPELIYCSPFDTLAGVVDSMDKRNLPFVLVMYENKIVGMITPDRVWRFQAMRRMSERT